MLGYIKLSQKTVSQFWWPGATNVTSLPLQCPQQVGGAQRCAFLMVDLLRYRADSLQQRGGSSEGLAPAIGCPDLELTPFAPVENP